MRSSCVAFVAAATVVNGDVCDAQKLPARIPTVLAQAMTLYFGSPILGRPGYPVGTAPVGWPKELLPAKARVIGGGMIGSPDGFRIRTLVVEMPAGVDPARAVNAMAVTAGYSPLSAAADSAQGGFIASSGEPQHMPLCKDKTSMFAFGVEAPNGVVSRPSGMSWNGMEGTTGATLVTTMPLDSILWHYTRQLVAAGWEVVGSALANSTIAVQKFRFRDGEEPWSARLMVEVVGNRREASLRVVAVSSGF